MTELSNQLYRFLHFRKIINHTVINISVTQNKTIQLHSIEIPILRLNYSVHYHVLYKENLYFLTFLPSKSCVTMASTLSTLGASAKVTNPKPLKQNIRPLVHNICNKNKLFLIPSGKSK